MLADVMQELESLGTAQNRKTYSRHGVSDPMFGLSFAHLRRIGKRIKKNHPLALELWDTGNHDARVLATLIADPKAVDAALLNRWVGDLNNYVLTDAFSTMVSKTPLAQEMAEQWVDSPDEWFGSAGWNLMSHLALTETSLPDEYFSPLIETIAHDIHQRQNRVRYSMNNALISIGIRSDLLQAQAIEAAEQIGPVDVDHGQTSCKTPDAAAYIHRTLKYRREKAAKRVKA